MGVQDEFGVSDADFRKWNVRIDEDCTNQDIVREFPFIIKVV